MSHKEKCFAQVAGNLPASIIREFNHALQRGCWRDGRPLTQKQRDICAKSILHAQLVSSCIH